MNSDWKTINPQGHFRVLITRRMIGEQWIRELTDAGARLDISALDAPLSKAAILEGIGSSCVGAIGQLYEPWDKDVLSRFKEAGGRVFSNYAVGYNNVDVAAATSLGIRVGNTPDVLTETTAELGVALTFAAARRIPEGDAYTRAGKFTSWSPTLYLGDLLWRKTLGLVGPGRIGSAYARMMVQGHRMDLLYLGRKANPILEREMEAFNAFLTAQGEAPLRCVRAESIRQLVSASDVVALFPSLNESTKHLINAERLRQMKPNAILVNVSRGPVVDEQALVEHCRRNPDFHAALDVYEQEPKLAPGLQELSNVVMMPHVGSGTRWTREAMALIAAKNVAGILTGKPVWTGPNVLPFLGENPPDAVPSIVNAKELGILR